MEQVAILPEFMYSTSVVLYKTKSIVVYVCFKELKRKYRQHEFFPYVQKVNSNDLTVIETLS